MTDAAAELYHLPPFADPNAVWKKAATLLLPPRRMLVSEAAAAFRVITTGGTVGPWRNATAPYMVEPMDCTTAREYEAVVFAGPARSSKTAALIENTLLHAVCCDPRETLLLHTGQNDARLYSLQKITPMIAASAEAKARLTTDRQRDNIFDKAFAGMTLVLGWPTINHLSAKDYELVLITELDRMADSVDGEGSPFHLARKRTQTFGSRGMTVVECSPGRDVIEQAEAAPLAPHEAPPTTGILELYNGGDRRLWHWMCPHCATAFEPAFRLLDWPKDDEGRPRGSIEEAAAKTVMICPHCGAEIEEKSKADLNACGRWLREGEVWHADGSITGMARRSTIASFWLKGPAAAFQSWPSLVRNWLQARATWERTGNVESLRTVVNVDLGEPFVPPRRPEDGAIDVEVLRARVEQDWHLGTVPAGVRAVVVEVDVQGRYFDWQATGFGPGFETWIVDRGQIVASAEDGRMVDPGAYAEDWDLLWPLLSRAWPLAADPSRGLRPLTMVVDSAGAPGVTGNAYRFAAEARRRGVGEQRFMLLKGDASVGDRRISLGKVDWMQSGRVLARGLKLLHVGSDALKDEVAAGLRRDTPGPGYVHAPADVHAEWFDQVTAETRNDKGRWRKKFQGIRNEALDHLVYGRAALLRPPYRWDRIDWARPPAWAAPLECNTMVVPVGGEAPAPTAPAVPLPVRGVVVSGQPSTHQWTNAGEMEF